MAEASVNTSNINKCFCHECNAQIYPKLPEYVCPDCNSGFIEIVENSAENESDNEMMRDADFEILDGFIDGQNISSQAGANASGGAASSSAPRRSQRFSNLNPLVRHDRRRHNQHQDPQQVFAPLLELITPAGWDYMGDFAAEIPVFSMIVPSNLASNPGNYAWGRGGLDAIITQLMNQIDGNGPPPLPQDKINLIPKVKITQEQCEKNLQCTVCMEDFKFEEIVRKLNCEHCYHEECIIPWLRLHGTCPVCRKTLVDMSENSMPTAQTQPQNAPVRLPRPFPSPRRRADRYSHMPLRFPLQPPVQNQQPQQQPSTEPTTYSAHNSTIELMDDDELD